MHSRIFVFAPDTSDDVLSEIPSEEELYDALSHVVDYVSEDTDLDEDVEWLKQWLGDDNFSLTRQKGSKYYQIQPTFFRKLIQHKLRESLQQAHTLLVDAQNLLETDADNFGPYPLWQISDLVYPRHDFYFYIIGEGGLMSWVDILPYCNKPYYIIKSFDYHT